jgi:hypothetical protein
MNPVKMSEAAYTEFKQFLDENNIDVSKNNIRINLAGVG